MLKNKIYIAVLVCLSACNQKPTSSLLLNQEKCATLNEKSIAVRDGLIINKNNNKVIGTVKVVDDETVAVSDINGEVRNLRVVLNAKVPDKRLLMILRDERNILLACGVD